MRDSSAAATWGAVAPDRWEHGSDFHLLQLEPTPTSQWTWPGGVLAAAGRDALALLVAGGVASRGWKRVLLPTYYCDDVAPRLRGLSVDVEPYSDGPERNAVLPDAVAGDVLVRVNYFGWGLSPLQVPFAGDIVEDHTHDPWSSPGSDADFCFASLRKTLPVPDGGVLWSPRGHALLEAPPLDTRHAGVALTKLAAMTLKRAYLLGGDVEKPMFRPLAARAEQGLGEGAVSGILPWSETALATYPVAAWRRTRAGNVGAFRTALGDMNGVDVLGPVDAEAPFAVILQARDEAARDRLRARLCEDAIYPAVLWPLAAGEADGTPAVDLRFSRTMMALHADARYSHADMVRVAERVRYHVVSLGL